MSFTSETWEWFKTAPLPVVLAITIVCFSTVGSYTYAVDKAQQKHAAEESSKVAVASERAKLAADTALRIEEKLDKLTEVLNQVILEREVWKARREERKEKK